MRRFALFLIFLFVLSAVPVKAETSYYAVSFDGVDDYVQIPALLNDGDDLSIILVFTPLSKSSRWAPTLTTYYGGWGFQLFDSRIDAKMMVNGTEYSVSVYSGSDYWGKTLFLAETVHYDAGTGETVLRGYKDGQFVGEKRVVGTTEMLSGRSWYLMKYYTCVTGGKVYVVLIYNRALSDAEIQQIYDNPNDPPRAGLILWYAPDSVDDVNGIWNDKSGLGNDGTIVGATSKRVSIIRVRDYKTNADITLKSTITNLDTGETLFQPLPMVDYNTPTTIKVEAPGYKTQIIKLGGFKPFYTVYMQPLLTELQIKFNVADYFPTAMWFLVTGVMGSIVAGIFSMSDKVGKKAKAVIAIVLGLIFFIYMLQFAL